MGKSRKNREAKRKEHRYPFHPGQSADDVFAIVRKTGRRCEHLEVTTSTDGDEEVYVFDLKSGTKSEIEARIASAGIDVKDIVEVKRTYGKLMLTFRKARLGKRVPAPGLPQGQPVTFGALCWRVVNIEEIGREESDDDQE